MSFSPARLSAVVPLAALLCLLLPAFAARAQFDTSSVGEGKRDPDVSIKIMQPAYAPGDRGVAAVVVDVPDGLHAQSHTPLDENLIAFTVTVAATDSVTNAEANYFAGSLEEYPGVGKLSVYVGQFVTYVSFKIPTDAKEGDIKLPISVRYQLCDDKGNCFPPKTIKLSADFKIAQGAAAGAVDPIFNDPRASVTPAPAAATQPTTSAAAVGVIEAPQASVTMAADSFRVFGLFNVGPLTYYILSAIGAGLLFNLMPCVLPVLPLKIAGFYEAAAHDRSRTIGFGLAFSAGMVAIFAVLATLLLAGRSLFGFDFQWGQQFSNPYFVWAMVAILAGLGLWMLGMFNVYLPSSVYGMNFRHDTYFGNFMWGGFTAVLSTPCTAPLFSPVLAFSLAQPVVIGLTLILLVGVGMALPYLLLSAYPEIARKMPRTGPVSEFVKQTLAFFLFATAAYFVGMRFVGDPNQWWFVVPVAIWGSSFILLRATQLFETSGAMVIVAAIATFLTGGSVLAALSFTGKFDAPLKLAGTNGIARSELFEPYSKEAFDNARKQNKPVLVKFTAAWCANCLVIQRNVYTDPKAIDALLARDVVLLKADLTLDDAPGWKHLDEFGRPGIPFTAVYWPGADKPETLASLYSTGALLALLERHAAGAAR